MRRHARLILLSLLAGFAINWLVAWSSGIIGGDDSDFSFRLTYGDATCTIWTRNRATVTFVQFYNELFLHSPDNAGTLWHTGYLMPEVRRGVKELQGAIARNEPRTGRSAWINEWVLLSSGWPLRSACCLVERDSPPSMRCVFMGSAPAISVGWYMGDIAYFPRFIAFRPVWIGLIVNTLLYALAVFLPIWLWRTRRARHRRRRGLCLACGYDLRGTPGLACPECGAQRDGVALTS